MRRLAAKARRELPRRADRGQAEAREQERVTAEVHDRPHDLFVEVVPRPHERTHERRVCVAIDAECARGIRHRALEHDRGAVVERMRERRRRLHPVEAVPIEDDQRKGWAWWELKDVAAPAEDLDALRLLAVFLAHWDNKADNQRLVCMDTDGRDSDPRCADPLLMIQDLGATFGPPKVNLSQWRTSPIWSDRATCTVSMRALPFGGSTYTATAAGVNTATAAVPTPGDPFKPDSSVPSCASNPDAVAVPVTRFNPANRAAKVLRGRFIPGAGQHRSTDGEALQ